MRVGRTTADTATVHSGHSDSDSGGWGEDYPSCSYLQCGVGWYAADCLLAFCDSDSGYLPDTGDSGGGDAICTACYCLPCGSAC